ncbi:putative tol protein [Metarhizium acridum CQMa 102]|uniref:Putative tol protein n=1 Tax=Metarhizium acridum (strain CQMa 102) TaxID=655827 RepID=E9ECE9_METAQ|nr:putative tol protein [Metarhizium acridum CQMa 102]EFY86402.1 putative tol protein [Metarhizium acridum CQMa 102]
MSEHAQSDPSVMVQLQSMFHAGTEALPPHLCQVCADMTGSAAGLSALISSQGYHHSTVPQVRQAAAGGCMFCSTVLDMVLTGHLYSRIPGQAAKRLQLDDTVRALVRSQGQVCDFHVLRTKVGFYMDRPIVFGAFTNAAEPVQICLVESAGNPVILSFKPQPLSISTVSDDMVEGYMRLLKECTTHHSSACPPDVEHLLPLRVIDVDCPGTPMNIGLVNNGNVPRYGRYTALSYCWGKPPHVFKTTTSVMQDPSLIDWSTAPGTILDAITITRRLGIRYLWVDAVCILQDDEDDKTTQIKDMARIYKNSAVTIVAASASGVNEGFIRDKSVKSIAFPVNAIDPTRNTVLHVGTLWVHANTPDEPEEPVDSRGWTLQESLLSPRILYYGSKDVIWKCQAKPFQPVVGSHNLYKPEGMRRLPSIIFGIQLPSTQSPLGHWPHIMSEYSRRKLSLDVDNFRAIGGIAEELQIASGDTYIAGLWKNNMAKSLAWFRTDRTVPRQAHDSSFRRPTWSWLTTLFPVAQIGIEADAGSGERVELLRWSVELADTTAPFGHVIGGALELSGQVIKASDIPLAVISTMTVMLDSGVSDDDDEQAGRFVGDEYYYLLLGNCGEGKDRIIMLLRELVDGTFVRCGVAHLDANKALSIWETERVRRTKVTLV